jgi:hypothetical protein
MLKHLKEKFQQILQKIGIIGKDVSKYISIALAFGSKIEAATHNPIIQLSIAELIPEQYQDEVEKLREAIPKAIGYLTDSSAILSSGSPDEMLTRFVSSLQHDAPGLQKTKIMRLLQEIVAHMDGNSLMRSVYDLLVQKQYTALKLGVEDTDQ